MQHEDKKELFLLEKIAHEITRFTDLVAKFEESQEKHETAILSHLKSIVTTLHKLYKAINVPNLLQIQFEGQEPGMDVTIVNSPTASALATPVEKNADGSVFTFNPNNIQWSVQDGTIVSFTQNSDGTALFKPLAVGATQVGVVDTATGLSATALVTVTAGQTGPTSMEIQWSNVTP